MKRQTQPHYIAVSLTPHIQLEARELAFLRTMAQHCIETRMLGSAACKTLDRLLRDMGITLYDGLPVYGLFE